MAPSPRILLLMGVAGSGKTTIGRRLAAELHWPYFEADDFHSAANKEKMGRGVPLTDADRTPWLAAIRARINQCIAEKQNAVFTCSALKASYRDHLMRGAETVSLVHLHGDPATISARVAERPGHFMKTSMVESQFAALEVPDHAFRVDTRDTPETIVAQIRQHLGL